jgi:hypothetical protein
MIMWMMGQTMSLNCVQQRPYCSSSRWYMGMESHVGMIWQGKTDSSTRSLQQSYQQCRLIENQAKLGKGNNEFCLRSIFVHTSKWFLIFREIILHGADSFTPPPKESVLRIFIALKNPSLRQGFNLRTLGTMVSMLTVTPQRQPSVFKCQRRKYYNIKTSKWNCTTIHRPSCVRYLTHREVFAQVSGS